MLEKISYKARVFAGVLMMGAISTTAYSAQVSKTEDTDETQKVYQRKAVMVLPEVAFESNKVPVNTVYCYKGKCKSGSTWNFPITYGLKDKVGHQVQNWLFQKRFDVIELRSGELQIITADKTIKVPAKGLSEFKADVISEKNYKNKLEGYLNNELAPFILPLQKAALEQRYSELSSNEKATFIRTQAKSLGLPLDLIPMLLDSQYVMAMYQPQSHAKLRMTYVKPKDKPAYYENDIVFDLSNHLYIYKYQSAIKKFEVFDVLTGEAGWGVSESNKTKFKPTKPEQLQNLFEVAFKSAVRSSLIQLVHKMKDIKDFQITSPVTGVKGNTLTSKIGAQEDLRVDALYRVQRNIDDKIQNIGLVKARKVSLANGTKSAQSEFALVKGNVEENDKLSETSWMGGYWAVDLISQGYTFDKVNGSKVKSPDQNVNWVRLEARTDQGYFMNKQKLSEVWLSLHLDLGAGGGKLDTVSPYMNDYGAPVALRLGADVMKHHTFGAGFSAGYGAGVDFTAMSFSSETQGGDSLSYSSLDALAKAEVTYLLGEQSQIGMFIGYPLALSSQAKIGDTETEVEFSPGLMFGVGFQYGFKSLGFLHSLYRH